jgi:serine/threonine protein kinase
MISKLFEREAQTLKSLSHPSIPSYLDYFEINSPNYQGFALIQTYSTSRCNEVHLILRQKVKFKKQED